MKVKTTVATLAVAAAVLAACGGGRGSIDVVSQSDDGIAIAAENESAMQRAADKAADYCGKTDRTAVLDRTEGVGGGAVAYYNCVAPPAETSQ